jgi:hypothetical protein
LVKIKAGSMLRDFTTVEGIIVLITTKARFRELGVLINKSKIFMYKRMCAYFFRCWAISDVFKCSLWLETVYWVRHGIHCLRE